MTYHPTTCIYCGQSNQTAPLLQFSYQGEGYWICPQHLPILIHKPAQLVDKLPGLERLSASEGHA